MRELIYTLLELEEWSRKTCDFCSNLYGEDNKSVNQIVTRIKANGKYVADDVVCEECKEKFKNNELLKCERCGRLQTKHYISFRTNEYICYCIRHNEDLEEELLEVFYENQSTFYERQINGLREELATAEEALEIEREEVVKFQEKSEEWGKRQKQELLDRIKELEKKVSELSRENEQLKELKKQLEQANQQLAQIEVPAKRLKTS